MCATELVAGMTAVTRRVREAPLQDRLRPGADAEPMQRLERLRRRRAREQRSLAERLHDDHAEAQLRCERQDLALRLAVARVVRHLHGSDPPTAHDPGELREGGWGVVRRTDRGDPPVDAQRLELVETPLPPDEVVDLVEVDPPSEGIEGERDLALRLVVVCRPDLRRNDCGVSASGECRAENALGLAVHRRAVEEAGATGEGGVDDSADVRLGGRTANVERAPRADPDHGDAQSGRPERALFHAQVAFAFDFLGFGTLGGSVRT